MAHAAPALIDVFTQMGRELSCPVWCAHMPARALQRERERVRAAAAAPCLA